MKQVFTFSLVVMLVFSFIGLTVKGNQVSAENQNVGSVNEVAEEAPAVIKVDWNAVKQTIDGFGASGAFHMANNLKGWGTEQTRDEILDLLFSQEKGIGLSWVRNMVGDGGLKEDGTQWGHAQDGPNPTFWPTENTKCWDESCGFWDDQIWLMNEAKERGVTNFMSSVWSPPAWMKENNSVINGGFLKKEYYQDFAEYISEYLQEYKQRFGIEIQAISPANEPNTVVGYSSSEWTPEQLHEFVKEYLIPTFKANNIGTKIILPEEEKFSEDLALPLLQDPDISADLPIVAVHDYHRNSAPLPVANALEKKVWMTEMFPRQGYPRDVTIETGIEWAKYVHKYLTETNASLVNYWWVLNRNSDSNSGLLHLDLEDNTSYYLSKRLFAFGQYTKFIRPGAIRIDATAKPAPGVYASAFKDPDTGEFSIVIVNENEYEKNLELELANFEADEVTPYLTDEEKNLEKSNNLKFANGVLKSVLPSRSIVTLVGTGNKIDIHPNKEYRIVNKQTGEVLEIKNSQNKDGAKAVLEKFNPGRKTQRWSFKQRFEGYYAISNVKSSRLLAVENNSTLSGAAVHQETENESPTQLWALESLADGTFRIVNRHTGKVLTQQENGKKAFQENYTGAEEQKWTIEEVEH